MLRLNLVGCTYSHLSLKCEKETGSLLGVAMDEETWCVDVECNVRYEVSKYMAMCYSLLIKLIASPQTSESHHFRYGVRFIVDDDDVSYLLCVSVLAVCQIIAH